MGEEELAEFRVNLEQVLIANGLEAAVEQVRAEASAGRVEERPPGKRKTRMGESDLRYDEVRIVELTERELVARLLDLAEVAVAGSLAVEDSLRAFGRSLVEDGVVELAEVRFSDPERSGAVSQGYSVSADVSTSDQERRVAAARVVELLNHARQVVNVKRSPWMTLVPDQRRESQSWVGQ